MAEDAHIHDFVCTACGCMCDDLVLTTNELCITSVVPPCPLAEAFFSEVSGGDASTHSFNPQLLKQAAEVLGAARAPLVMGLEKATIDAQRLAVAIADRLGAFIDPTDERGISRSHTAVQTVGAVTATLGEVASRSDVVVYWECDPATTHPRHIERFASREGQRRLVVDSWPSPTAALVDDYLLIPTGSGFECLATLCALLRNIELDSDDVEQRTGNSLEDWQRLADALKAARYATIFYGASDATQQAIIELVRDLHRHTRAVALPLGAAFNAVGAAQVLTWQTGFPAAVSFARGYPQYLPGEATAVRLLERGEVDAALIIGADPLPHLTRKSAAHFRAVPTVVIDDREESATLSAASVAIRTARFGVQVPGHAYRSDGIPLPLRAATTSPLPTMAEILAQLAACLEI